MQEVSGSIPLTSTRFFEGVSGSGTLSFLGAAAGFRKNCGSRKQLARQEILTGILCNGTALRRPVIP